MTRICDLLLLLLLSCSDLQHVLSKADGGLTTSPVGNGCSKVEPVDESDKEELEERFSYNNFPLLNCSSMNETFFASRLNDLNDVKHLLLEGSGIFNASLKSLRHFPNLTSLSFKGYPSFQIIPINHSFANVRSVTFAGTPLFALPVDELRDFKSLEHLSIFNANISKLNENVTLDFPNLSVLSLAHNSLSNVDVMWLARAENLRSFTLRSVNLTTVPYGIRKAKYLKYLDMSGNSLASLPVRSFRRAAMLTTLILSNNRISVVDRNAFKGTFSLKFIDLTGNSLSTLPQGIFDAMPADDFTVELWENPIDCDCRLRWLRAWMDSASKQSTYPDVQLKCTNEKRLSSLAQWLSHDFACRHTADGTSDVPKTSTPQSNTIPATSAPQSPPAVISNYTCASPCACYGSKDEYLQHHIRLIRNNAFPLISCQQNASALFGTDSSKFASGVRMTNSIMKKLSVAQLATFTSATTLSFENNDIEILTPAQNVVLEKVRSLSLESNQIRAISKEFLKSFPMLRKLKLFNNKIMHFADDLFLYNRLLNKVFLGPNPVQPSFTGKCLANLSLELLGLRKVGLEVVPSVIKHMTTLARLDLSENSITSLSTHDFSGCKSLIKLSLENNNISSIEVGTFSNLQHLEDLDLSENSLVHLEQGTFSNISEPQLHIELWQNPFLCDCRLKWFIEWINEVEINNPSRKIRFQCTRPSSMRDKVSDQTKPQQYVCSKASKCSDCNASQVPSNDMTISNKGLALAILLTVVLTLCVDFMLRKCVFNRMRRKRSRNCHKDEPMVAFARYDGGETAYTKLGD